MADHMNVMMLPAQEGDCLLVACGENPAKHILIDGGRAWTYKNVLKKFLMENQIQEIELLIVTHVDRDHIDGMYEFIKDQARHLHVKNNWFNTFDHLHGLKIVNPASNDETEQFGARMGEELSKEIITKGWSWNGQFAGKAVELQNDPQANIIKIGNIKLHLLSPDRNKLQALIRDWENECREAGIAPGFAVKDYVVTDEGVEHFGAMDIEALADEEFIQDDSTANGSSIAFILEYKKRKILFTGDSHPDMLIQSLEKLGASKNKSIKLDAFKVPHHGSKHNISKELLDLVQCEHFLLSTNGNYFQHPDAVAMARIIKYGTAGSTINFNYKTDFSKIWENSNWQEKYKYKTNYPDDNKNGYLNMEFGIS
jgi:beta-lactamase superfamily II metal-dependent hydrolase